MNYLYGKYYVEVKNKGDTILPNGKKIIRLPDPTKSLRTQ